MTLRLVKNLFPSLTVVVALTAGQFLAAQEWKSGVKWPEPKVVVPGQANNGPPSDAIVLFDGTSLKEWNGGDRWLVKDGVAIPQEGDITTKRKFGDVQLHLEWSSPTEIEGEGQGRGNSGVFLMGEYEVQILDSYRNTTYFDGQAAAIYKQTPPMVNAMRPPGEWNTYDIIFSAPKFRVNGTLSQPAHITVLHNGVLVLNHFEILGTTGYTQAPGYSAHAEQGPIAIQYHRDAVRFRNIWVRKIKPIVGRRVSAPFNVEPKPEKKEPEEKTEADSEADG